jgi:hypothetical protein
MDRLIVSADRVVLGTDYPMIMGGFDSVNKMNSPAPSFGVSELGDEICPKGVTPECFYRGSSSEPAWIPA